MNIMDLQNQYQRELVNMVADTIRSFGHEVDQFNGIIYIKDKTVTTNNIRQLVKGKIPGKSGMINDIFEHIVIIESPEL